MPAERRREFERLAFRPDRYCDPGDENENEADGEKYLVKLAGAIKPAIEQPLEHSAERHGGEEAERQGRAEADMRAVHRQHDDVAAEHGESAVGEVDEPHQPHRHRKPDGDDEQHRAGGQAAQQDADEITGKIHGQPLTAGRGERRTASGE